MPYVSGLDEEDPFLDRDEASLMAKRVRVSALTLIDAIREYATGLGYQVSASDHAHTYLFTPLDSPPYDLGPSAADCAVYRRGAKLRPQSPNQPLEADDWVVLTVLIC
jgi:hypothetical protein